MHNHTALNTNRNGAIARVAHSPRTVPHTTVLPPRIDPANAGGHELERSMSELLRAQERTDDQLRDLRKALETLTAMVAQLDTKGRDVPNLTATEVGARLGADPKAVGRRAGQLRLKETTLFDSDVGLYTPAAVDVLRPWFSGKSK